MSNENDTKPPSNDRKSRISRRNFLRTLSGGAAAAVVGAGVPFGVAQATQDTEWDHETDVVVVGSGAAAGAAAVAAHIGGASVIQVEKSSAYGGTTAKSGGTYWVPNNPSLREHGLEDPKEDAIRYMARLAFPVQYREDDELFGLRQDQYDLFDAFYENGPRVLTTLADAGALKTTMSMSWDGQPTPDYYAHIPENKAPRGRAVGPLLDDGSKGFGIHLIGQLRTYIQNAGIPILMQHRVTNLLTNSEGTVVGVQAVVGSGPENAEAETVNIRARQGVAFGSGGFTHNHRLRENYLRGPIYGGCAVPTNEGDLVTMAEEMGVQLGNMNEAFFQEEILEEVLEFASVPSGVWFLTGDSMITVNRYGERVYNEKFVYNERTRTHFTWDPLRSEYTNLFLFFLYDQRTADLYPGGGGPIPPADAESPYVIQGETWEELAQNIDARLADLEERIGTFRLAETFQPTLQDTVSRFNQFAIDGNDQDFQRGETPIGAHFHGPRKDGNDHPNPYMHPLSETGPYYCIILAPGTLDTKGGPVTNTKSNFLDADGEPIPGLYGGGNCVASLSGQAYWGAGGTLGPALTFGFLAGENAAQEPVKEV